MTAARRSKLAAAFAVAAVAASLLTACQSRVGAAAYVGPTRISESTVGKYLGRSAAIHVDSSSGLPDNPKSDVLSSLIVVQLIDRVFVTLPGGPPSTAALAAARSSALQQSGATSLAALETAAETAGYTKSFADLYVDEQAKIAIVEADLKDANGAALLKAISGLHVNVSVSPRYGDWHADILSVTAGPSLPSFLQVADDASTASTGDGTAG